MITRVWTLVLLVALSGSVMVLIPRTGAIHLPGNQQDYEPPQPIAFSHRLHAGELQISCLYCHAGAEISRHAGIPAASTCMNCHKLVAAPWGAIRAEEELAKKENRQPHSVVSPEIQKLYDALGLNERMQPDATKSMRPIVWNKVHDLPDFVYFDHRAHVNAGVICQQCHGPVETMERVRQVQNLTMGWCVNCHRDVTRNGLAGEKVYASIDCSTCHY